jgi:hypothetical protein
MTAVVFRVLGFLVLIVIGASFVTYRLPVIDAGCASAGNCSNTQ